MRNLLTRIALVTAASCAAVAGCVGSIGDAPPPPPVDPGDPGRVTVHRLNNTEYNNTVRDLLGTERAPADEFPIDDYSHGFDNIADVLSMSPIQVELYHRAAHELALEAMHDAIVVEDHLVEAEDVGGTTGHVNPADTAWVFNLPGRLDATMALPEAGTYVIQVRAWGRQAGDELAKMEVSIDGEPIATIEVDAVFSAPKVYEIEHEFYAGPAGVSVAFINDFSDVAQNLNRNLIVDWVSLRGPLGATGETPIRDAILSCDPSGDDPEPCLREIITSFGKRAWRRPLSDDEVNDALALFELAVAEGGDAHDGIQLIIEDFLASPHFLFRFEIDPDPTSLEPRPLDDYELSSRLSYFLWSSMPDDELFAAADAGLLGQPDELRRQVERMLADPKADALVENFAAQWLFLRGLEDHAPDAEAFPEFDEKLRLSMIEETKRFFTEFLHDDLPVSEMLTAEFTFIDERLAAHYGMPFTGSSFEKVSLAETERSGLLGQASILTVTSHPNRTSPVKRGQWVLEQLLCSGPPPPPPGVEGLLSEGPVTGSIREQMEQHRTDPACIACHKAMDPVGFALEHFDAIGNWRDVDGEYEIDATGVLPDGQSFDGAVELGAVLAGDPRFTRCMTEKMMTYALGRGVELNDEPVVDRIHDEFLAGGASLRELITLVATSYPFLYRRGEPIQ